MKFHSYAALKPKGPLVSHALDSPPLKPYDVLVRLTHCGLCHTDIHLIDDNWKRSSYPLIPGHEAVGVIAQTGSAVPSTEIGRRVGIGWVRAACMNCRCCMQGDSNLCAQRTTGSNASGGFADHLIADSRFVYPIPDALDSAHAAPLLCAGASVYAPLRKFALQGPHKVAVLGIGGLGHLALQFASAFGCETTALSHSPSKKEEALGFGASHFATYDSLPGSPFDLILSTVHEDLDWNRILALLKPNGVLCFLGRPPHPASIDVSLLISPPRTIAGSTNANRFLMNEMLAFAARKNIRPQIELLPLSRINEGIARLKAGQVRYRLVFEME